MSVELPLPVSRGGPVRPFDELVDAYQAEHGITRVEVLRRISAVTGNSVKSLTTKYYDGRGRFIWWGTRSAREREALGQGQ